MNNRPGSIPLKKGIEQISTKLALWLVEDRKLTTQSFVTKSATLMQAHKSTRLNNNVN